MAEKTAFVGLSHMGQVTSICWASLGVTVIGIDEDIKIIKKLRDGKVVSEESDLPAIYKKAKKRISFASDFAEISKAKIVFFAQDSQLTGINHLQKLTEQLQKSIQYFSKNVCIVIMSQVPPSFCRNTLEMIKNKRPDLQFSLYHWVDTIIMTQAVSRILHPERIIVGIDNKDTKIDLIFKKQLSLFDCPVVLMNYESAEMTKAAINLYLSTSVTYANTLSDYCEKTGADINDVVSALRLDKRIGHAYLRPGLRIAGGHLERDLAMLEDLGKAKKINTAVVEFIRDSNETRYKWVLDNLERHVFHSKKKPTITIWGLSYKKDSDSTYNAPSTKIIPKISKKSKLYVYDPMAIMPNKIVGYKRFGNKYEALKSADCLIILTEWDEFISADISKIAKQLSGKTIIDCVGALYQKRKYLLKLNYVCMGVGNLIN